MILGRFPSWLTVPCPFNVVLRASVEDFGIDDFFDFVLGFFVDDYRWGCRFGLSW